MLAGIWLVMSGVYSAHNTLVDLQAKGQIDLLGDSRTAETRVALLHFHDGIYDFSLWPLWTSLLPAVW